MCALPLDGTSALALSPMHRVCPCTASTHTRLPRPLSPELSSKIVGVKTRIHPAKSIAGVGRHAADVAAAIVEDARAAARAAAAAREAQEAEVRRRVAEDADGEEPVLTLAEAMAREEAAEAEAAVASLNDRRDEWEPCVDNATGATYYVHYQTGESSWEKPTAAN
mmetsp:Transcript_15223/g.47119  ORF Transcript_15223/g.47119 Transcript_15223/m.47119 type:complete len:166 (+) Transcript_15223:329-826(+)